MQIGVDVTYMYTNFGGHDLSSFRDTATLKTAKFPFLTMDKFPFLTMDYSPWSSKNLIDQNQLKKFRQIGVDVTCMHTNFGWRDPSSFGDTATLKNGKIFLPDHGLYIIHGHQKI